MVKALLGDRYLCTEELKKLIPGDIKNNSFCYKETDEFGGEEIMFLSSMNLFGRSTLVYKTTKLESNDTLLEFLESADDVDSDLYIVAEKMVKGRKLYNKLNSMNVISNFEVTTKTFSALVEQASKQNGEKFTSNQISYIAKRCGLYEKDVVISALDIINWCKRLSIVGYSKEAVNEIVPEYKPDNVWLLKDSLLEKDSALVMEIADNIIATKGSPIAVLSAVVGDFRLALKLSYFADNKSLKDKAMKEMGTTRVPFLCNKYNVLQLSNCYTRLCKAIENLKSGYPPLEFKSALADCIVYLQ